MRLMGFRFFRPTVCPKCQTDETTARRELWRILNAASGVGLQQCMEELKQQQEVYDESDGGDEGDEGDGGDESDGGATRTDAK